MQNGLAIRNIAVATDFSPWSDRALPHALLVARQYRVSLHILHAVRRSEFPFVPDMVVPLGDLADRDSIDLVGRLQAAHSLDDIDYRCWNLPGELSVLGDFVRDQNIDLLVLGTRGRNGISKLLLGSVAEEISHCVSCPVLTVGPCSRDAASRLELSNVLFATDLSPHSATAMPYVLAAAKMGRAEIDVLHVCSGQSSDCKQRMETYRAQMRAAQGIEPAISIRYHVLPGAPSSTVLDFARRSGQGLIVLGLDHHRSLYAGSPQSHAYHIVAQARCPVLSVRTAPAPSVHP